MSHWHQWFESSPRLSYYRRLSDLLSELKLEPDQRFRSALENSGRAVFDDTALFIELYRLNTLLTRTITLNPGILEALARSRKVNYERVALSPSRTIGNNVLYRALHLASSEKTQTFGSRTYLRALIEECVDKGDTYRERPFAADLIASSLGLSHTTLLSKAPEFQRLLDIFRVASIGEEDYQFIVALADNRLVFRVVSVLGDYVQARSDEGASPQRALLTHFRDNFGGFLQDEIDELESLLNDHRAREEEFQRFLEDHPHFFRIWDYREVHPHVCLVRPEGDLFPDFILTDQNLVRPAIVELKLPRAKLIRRQRNRTRFAAAVGEARSQLLTYREWFRSQTNRKHLAASVGMEIYEPHLITIIGRSEEFLTPVENQRLRADFAPVDVVTYDDILARAKRRRLLLSCGAG